MFLWAEAKQLKTGSVALLRTWWASLWATPFIFLEMWNTCEWRSSVILKKSASGALIAHGVESAETLLVAAAFAKEMLSVRKVGCATCNSWAILAARRRASPATWMGEVVVGAEAWTCTSTFLLLWMNLRKTPMPVATLPFGKPGTFEHLKEAS